MVRVVWFGMTSLKGAQTGVSIGTSEVSYLDIVSVCIGMAPDPKKVQAVQDWSQPTEAHAVRQFHGLASIIADIIFLFANIASPLHLKKKEVTYNWIPECETAFHTLK